MKNKYIFVLIFTIVSSLVLSSCEEDEDIVKVPDQLFRPILSATVDGGQIDLMWTSVENATYYLEVSKDSLLFETDLLTATVEGRIYYRVDNLWSNALYSARIKAVSSNSDIKDSEFSELFVYTGEDNVFYTPEDADITATSVMLSWDLTKDVSNIVVSAEGVDDTSVTLTPEEILVGSKLIEGLSSNTEYTFQIYLGEILRGTVTVITAGS